MQKKGRETNKNLFVGFEDLTVATTKQYYLLESDPV
jgi:hypothetical protein